MKILPPPDENMHAIISEAIKPPHQHEEHFAPFGPFNLAVFFAWLRGPLHSERQSEAEKVARAVAVHKVIVGDAQNIEDMASSGRFFDP